MSKTIVEITSSLEMAGFIKSNGTQCRFVSILTDTVVSKIKKGNPFPGLRKVSRKMGIVNANYNMSVRRLIAENKGVTLAEAEYTNGEVWYCHLTTMDGKPLPLVQHKDETKRGKLYLQYFPHKAESKYVLPNGDTVSHEDVKPWLYKEKEWDENKPVVISIDLDNIKQIKASGVIMQAEDLEEAESLFSK